MIRYYLSGTWKEIFGPSSLSNSEKKIPSKSLIWANHQVAILILAADICGSKIDLTFLFGSKVVGILEVGSH